MHTIKKSILFLLVILFSGKMFAQNYHEFLARVNYQNVGFVALDSFPGVAWIGDNAAYDENNKRFFFQGNDFSLSLPWELFTVNALTGAIISQAPIYDHVCCLQYDNSCDTLYGIYYTSGGQYYSTWIEPSTGVLHLKNLLPGINGYASGVSAFDEIHHRLIFYGTTNNGPRLVAVDAQTGQLLAASPFSNSSSLGMLEYDDTNNHLYGIGTGSIVQFDSIEELTGVQHLISQLPNEGIYQSGISAIDEANNKYIFCGHSQQVNADSLFTLDLQTGAILSQQYYPYANAALFTIQNLIFFCFDQSAGQLYALHWGDKGSETAVTENNLDENIFQVMPNPCSEGFTLTCNRAYEQLSVMLYNALGALVETENGNQVSVMKISTDALSSGVYFMSVVADGKECGMKKIIVQ